jgi:hypothetical protein
MPKQHPCPALSRASTSPFANRIKDVGGRVNPGHDELGSDPSQTGSALAIGSDSRFDAGEEAVPGRRLHARARLHAGEPLAQIGVVGKDCLALGGQRKHR